MKRPLSFTLGIFSVLCLGNFSTPAQAAAEMKYPRISEVTGKVSWTDREGKISPPKKNQLLVEKAVIETAGGAKATLQLDAHRRVQLWPNTRVELPAISWETGEAPIVWLKQGTVRWKQPTKGTYNIALTSDLFEFLPPDGDYIFSFDPKAATAEVKVVEGSILFSAMHAEDTAEVSSGHKCQFQGVKENGEIVYDVLLKGKKIPRGRLGKVTPFSAEEKRLYSADALKKEAAVLARQQKAAELARENAKDPLQICTSPGARLNQCVWRCSGNPGKEKKVCRLEKEEVHCLRQRCNANGEWAEETEVTGDRAKSLCSATPRVRDCDY